MTIARGTKAALDYANGPFGYSQSSSPTTGRMSGIDHRPGNFDCTGFCGAVQFKAGFIRRSDLKGTFYSGNIVKRLVDTGMYYSISLKGKSFAQIKKMLREGDTVRGVGHAVYMVSSTKCVSFEISEKGTTHGKVGDQTGKEGRVREFYNRSRGWSHIIRPYAFSTHLGRAIAAYAEGRSQSVHRDRMTRRAPWDGPRMIAFLDQWAALDKNGMSFWYDPESLPWPSVPDNHLFVVLGSKLNDDGSMPGKFARRLKLVLPILLKYKNAKVLVSGGKPIKGHTEAAAGRDWLIAHGVGADQIFVEEKSTSTIGNAKYSVEFMTLREFTSYTLVSDVKQLRRAQIEFHAAQAAREIVNNGHIQLSAGIPLAYNDYGKEPIAPEYPVSVVSRKTVATEVAALLGVSAPYKAAL